MSVAATTALPALGSRLHKEKEQAEVPLSVMSSPFGSIATMERLKGVTPLAEPRTLQTEADYDAALAAVAQLMEQSPRRGTPDGERLVAFYECVEVYEDTHYPVGG